MNRFVTIENLDIFRTRKVREEVTQTLQAVFTQVIDKQCFKLMLEYIDTYLGQKNPNLIREDHKAVLINDRSILDDIMKKSTRRSARGAVRFSNKSAQELMAAGVSQCTIQTGQERRWVLRIREEVITKGLDVTKTEDYKRYRLIPGQHLFYYGAFTGAFAPSSLNFATHHFIYLYNGLILEVGAEFAPACIDAKTQSYSVLDMLRNPRRAAYKNSMSFFGISTIYESVDKWAEAYGQDKFFMYEFPNDTSLGVIRNRLSRAVEIIGKWSYSLFLQSHNCENAATYISVGEDVSTQSCVSDLALNSISAMLNKIPFVSSSKKGYVTPGPLYKATTEYDLKLSAEVPNCDGRSYAERYVSDNNYICKGSPFIDDEYLLTSSCYVDPKLCKSADCPKTDHVSSDKQRNICRRGKGTYIILE